MLRNTQEERRPHINIFRLVSIMIYCITTLAKSKLPSFKDATITEHFSDSNLVTDSTALMVLTYPYFPLALCFYVP